MKKFIRVSLLFLLFLLLPVKPVFAGTITELKAVINNDKKVTITGSISTGASQTINVRVNDPKGAVDYLATAVSAKDGTFTFSYMLKNRNYGTYTVTVNAYKADQCSKTSFQYGTNCDLDSLIISSGKLNQQFSKGATDYEVTVDSSVSRLKLLPTTSEASAVIDVNGTTVTSGKVTKGIMLESDKETLIKITVTALSGDKKTYNLTVKKTVTVTTVLTAASSISTEKLVKIKGSISSGAGHNVTIRVTNPDKKLVYANTTVSEADGNYECSFKLTSSTEGKYSVQVRADGMEEVITSVFYYITKVFLNSLSISGITLSPVFKSDVMQYQASTDLDEITIIPDAIDGGEEILVNKQEVKDGEESKPIHLKNGTNTITVAVMAQSGKLSKTYTLVINKEEKTPSMTLKAQIDGKKTVSIDGTTGAKKKIAVTLRITDPKGSIEYMNTVESKEDGSYQLTYTLTNKEPGTYKVSAAMNGLLIPITATFEYNPNACLTSLTTTGASFMPGFTGDQLNYTAEVGYGTSYVGITAVAEYEDSEITVNDTTATGRIALSEIKLEVGTNLISVVVKNHDKTMTYCVTIVRKAETMPIPTLTPEPILSPIPTLTPEPILTPEPTLSPIPTLTPTPVPTQQPAISGDDATLSSLILNPDTGELAQYPTFSSGIDYYRAHVYTKTATVTLEAHATDENASITVWNDSVEDSLPTTLTSDLSSVNLELEEGENLIKLQVTAEDGTTNKLYTVRLIRSDCDPNSGTYTFYRANLIDDTIYCIPFDAENQNVYTITKMSGEDFVQFLRWGMNTYSFTVIRNTTLNQSKEVIADNGQLSDPVLLGAGINELEIIGYAEDCSTTETYHVKVCDLSLSNLQLSKGILSPEFSSAATTYSTEVKDTIITINPVAYASENTTITVQKMVSGSGVTINSQDIPLDIGSNQIKVIVSSTVDPELTLTYILNISCKFQPISMTGFNEDVVANGSDNQDDQTYLPAKTTTAGMDNEGNILYEQGYYSTQTFLGNGLPSNRTVTTDTSNYQLENYTGNNALLIKDTASYTLTLNQGVSYKALSIFATGISGASAWKVTLHFADGSSSDYTINVVDWCDSSYNFDLRVHRITREYTPDWFNSPGLDGYSFNLSEEDQLKTLSSITFTRSSDSGALAVFAVSGL